MKTYIQSRGKSQDHDYTWLEVAKSEEQNSLIPPELKDIRPGDIIDSQKPSIILAHNKSKIVLLVTALRTRDERTDLVGRRIRNSVVWIATKGGDKELLFRKLTIAALRGNLESAIDKAVDSDHNSPYGFRVSYDELQAIKERVDEEQEDCANGIASTGHKVGGDNIKLKEELIEELREHPLPSASDDTQILVAVTTMKSEKGLKEQNVWRGLSRRIKSEDWIEYKPSDCNESGSKKNNQKSTTRVVLFLILLAGVIAIIIWIVTQKLTPLQVQTEQSIAPQTQTETLDLGDQKLEEVPVMTQVKPVL